MLYHGGSRQCLEVISGRVSSIPKPRHFSTKLSNNGPNGLRFIVEQCFGGAVCIWSSTGILVGTIFAGHEPSSLQGRVNFFLYRNYLLEWFCMRPEMHTQYFQDMSTKHGSPLFKGGFISFYRLFIIVRTHRDANPVMHWVQLLWICGLADPYTM